MMRSVRRGELAAGEFALAILLQASTTAAQVRNDGDDAGASGAAAPATAPPSITQPGPPPEEQRGTVAPPSPTPTLTAVAGEGPPPPNGHPRGISFPVRLGLGVTPLIGYSPITAGWGKVHTLRNGGWVPVDVAPAVRIWRSITVELAISAMIPVQDPWGFPAFRLAATPGVRVDGSRVYARIGIPFMFGGDGTRVGIQAAAGITFWKPFYAGLAGFASPRDLIIGAGPEVGIRFDDLRLGW